MRVSPLLVACALIGCDRLDPDGVFVGEPCDEQRVVTLFPPDGSVEGYIAGPVWIDLTCPAQGSALEVVRSDGRAAPGTLSLHHGGRQARWWPSERLNHQTQYRVEFESDDGAVEWSFTTNGVGAPTNNRLTGVAFALVPSDGRLLDPPGLDDLLLPALADGFFPVLQLEGDPGGPQGSVPLSLGGRLDPSGDAAHDPDVPVRALDARWDNPLLEFGPLRMEWPLDAFDFVIENARFGGGVSPDVAWGAGFSVEGWWDLRPVGEWSTLCSSAAAAGTDCTECSDGVRACVRLELVGVRAQPWSGRLGAG